MKKMLLVFLSLALSLSVLADPGSPLTKESIKDHYIVTLKPAGKPHDVAAAHQIKPKHFYTKALNGFAAELNAGQLNALSHRPDVARVEADGLVDINTTQTNPTWGLDRIDQPTGLSQSYNCTYNGRGVTAYIIDSGIIDNHTDFGGRAKLGKSFVLSDSCSNGDCNGHGTHVAGTIGSSTYGVAKGVTLVGVKVLNGAGSGTWSGVIAGIDYVATVHLPGQPAVANLSLGGGKNQAVDDAINKLVADGVFVVAAAGNNGGDACAISPAGAVGSYAVGAIDNTDRLASFSNRGKCVSIFAPGVNITSLWKGINNATNTISGTSMAAPHVAGVAALYCSKVGPTTCTPANVRLWLNTNSTKNVVSGLDLLSPNRTLFKSSL